ncbi:MAG: MFS transporter [Clostridiales Family XIII bacterium]|jgi:DHA3 family macrolide efflux protein-like MFS transporter|nr:MFS transporter [Clostridiales Family XIII bacterium]
MERNGENPWKRNVGLFLAGQAVSLVGSSLVGYAVLWYMTLRTGSGAVMTAFILATMLPTFFMSPFGGVWADRYNRRNLINIADACIAVASLCVAALFSAGSGAMWLLFLCLIVRSLGQGVQFPAVGALIPQLVPEEHLVRVNGIQTAIQSVANLGSPALGAALLKFASIQAALYVDVLTAAVGIAILAFLVKVPARDAVIQKNASYFREMKDGLAYTSGRAWLKMLFVFAAVFLVLISPVAFLTPLQVARDFGEDEWLLMAIELAFSAGIIGGGVLVSVWGGFSDRIKTIVLGAVLLGISTIALGLLTNFPLYLVAMALCGFSMPLVNTPFQAIIQSRVEDAFLGRVTSVWTMITTLIMPLSMLAFGPLADLVNIDWMLVVSGAATIVACPLMAANRALREIRV